MQSTRVSYLSVPGPFFSCAPALEKEWQAVTFGAFIGQTGFWTGDLDGDRADEIVATATTGSAFWDNDVFFVVKSSGTGEYQQTRASFIYGVLGRAINKLVVGGTDPNGRREIFVGLSDGYVDVYDALSLEKTATFSTGGTAALAAGDADGDGDAEILTSDGDDLFVYSSLPPYRLEWRGEGLGGSDLAVGNVDHDPAAEIVSARGLVIDGVTHDVEWTSNEAFGVRILLSDVDLDRVNEIVGADWWRRIGVFDGDLRAQKYEIVLDAYIASLAVGDPDAEGTPEILWGDGQGDLHVHDGLTGAEEWSLQNPSHGVFSVAVGDLDGDGEREVAWGADFGGLFVADGTFRTIEWAGGGLEEPYQSAQVGDVDGDGDLEIVVGGAGSVIQVLDARTHALEAGHVDATGRSVDTLRVGDVDGDGAAEIVYPTRDGHDNGIVAVLDGRTLATKWRSTPYSGNWITVVEIADVDGDGAAEILAGQVQGSTAASGVSVLVYDGASGVEEWRSPSLGVSWGLVWDIEVADLDGDGSKEIAVSAVNQQAAVFDGRMVVFDGVTHRRKLLVPTSTFALAAANVDGDARTELLAGKPDGIVEVYDIAIRSLQDTPRIGEFAVLGLQVGDVDEDGEVEWLMTDPGSLWVMDGATKAPRSINFDLGFFPGAFNQITSVDLDDDGRREFLIRSDSGLFRLSTLPRANVSPVAAPGGPYRAVAGREVVLDASGSYDGDGVQLEYAWDFEGDGRIDWMGLEPQSRHTYRVTGTYRARLIVEDLAGVCDSSEAEVVVEPNRPPLARAGGPYRGLPGRPITFDASLSSDPDGSIVLYEWDLDEVKGYERAVASPVLTSTFDKPGRFNVWLRVWDDLSGSNVASASVVVVRSGLALVTPVGGESLRSGERFVIRWLSDSRSATVNVYYSLDGGKWIPIVKGVSAGLEEYEWTVPSVSRVYERSRLRIAGYSDTGARVVSVRTARPFSLEP